MRAARISAQVPVSTIPFSLPRFPQYCALSRARALPSALDSRFLARSSSFLARSSMACPTAFVMISFF